MEIGFGVAPGYQNLQRGGFGPPKGAYAMENYTAQDAFDEETLSETAAHWGENFTVDKMIEGYERAYRDFLSLKQTPHRKRMTTR